MQIASLVEKLIDENLNISIYIVDSIIDGLRVYLISVVTVISYLNYEVNVRIIHINLPINVYWSYSCNIMIPILLYNSRCKARNVICNTVVLIQGLGKDSVVSLKSKDGISSWLISFNEYAQHFE